MKRRKFIVSAVAAAAGVELLGCGGGSSGSDAPPAPTGSVAWDPRPLLFLAESSSSIDLSQSLPVGVRRGGVFGIAVGSSPLPSQLTLSPNGLLLASGAQVSTTRNIVFTYQEPA